MYDVDSRWGYEFRTKYMYGLEASRRVLDQDWCSVETIEARIELR